MYRDDNGNENKPLNDPDPVQSSGRGLIGGTGGPDGGNEAMHKTGEPKDGKEPIHGAGELKDGKEPIHGAGEPKDGGWQVHVTNEPYANHDDKPDDNAPDEDDDRYGNDHGEDEEDVDLDDEPPARRKWIKNTVVVLLVAALIGNILAFWPRIFNMETLPLLFKSRELSGREEVRNYKKAIVSIATDKGKGTGFHISGGYIVTNHHVIEDAAYTIVEFSESNARYAAQVAGFDPDLDIAVLRVDSGGKQLPFIEIEREHEWEPGEHIYVIGNPLYLKQIASEGRVLGTMPIQGRSRPVMVVDAPVRKGNSGSPVINEHGRAIAVIYATTEITHQGKTGQVGLAVPLRDLDTLLRDLQLEK